MAGMADNCSHTDGTRQAYCTIESRGGVWTLSIAAARVACCSPQASLKSAPSPLWLSAHLVLQAAPAADGAVSAVCHGHNPTAAAERHAEAGAAAAAALQQAARQPCSSWRSRHGGLDGRRAV